MPHRLNTKPPYGYDVPLRGVRLALATGHVGCHVIKCNAVKWGAAGPFATVSIWLDRLCQATADRLLPFTTAGYGTVARALLPSMYLTLLIRELRILSH